jgi:hypothetical protein
MEVVKYATLYPGKRKIKFGFEFSQAVPAHTSDDDILKIR